MEQRILGCKTKLLENKNEFLVIASTMTSNISEVSVAQKYDMNHEKRGVALVINIRTFKDNGEEERVWSEKDFEDLKLMEDI